MKSVIAMTLMLTAFAQAAGSAGVSSMAVVATAENDLFAVLSANKVACRRFGSAGEAVAAVDVGGGVLVLADGYPGKVTTIDPAVLAAAAKKKLRVYVEYPAALPGVEVGKPRKATVERVVVGSRFFGDGLKQLRIVSVNGLHYVPVEAKDAHLVAARVAGFDSAVYGLPEKTAPVLFELPGKNVLVSTTCLSRFVTGRYAPQEAWREVWGAILQWLRPGGAKLPALQWTPTVRASYARNEALPADYELQAIKRGLDWFGKAKMIVHPSYAKQIAGKERIDSLPADAPMGDGSLGALEAVMSVIHQDGSQTVSTVERGDCICETAMAMAIGGKLLNKPEYMKIGTNLLDYYLLKSDARKKERGDPKHGAYGLIAWGITTPAWQKANYGDDNARQMMGTWAVAAINGQTQWDEAMMMCLLANLRTTGQLGFRGSRIDVGALGGGWERYLRGKPVSYAPHFENYLWACYLWAYRQTGDELFLNRAETALKMTMAQHTDGWRWTNGLAQERARIILPLAWLVRVKDTPETRAMLRKAVDGLLKLQAPCGAIREELGLPGKGVYPPPKTNAAYGGNEASLIAANGDPVADLLYTTNFAFLGLHEAAAATGDKDIIAAEHKLAEFLCRIQVRAKSQPAVDGGWFRAFDFQRWEHWGSNADHGWGAWSIESGWTQGWITAVLAMRQMDTSLWDLTAGSKIERHHARLRKRMLPADAIASPPTSVAAKTVVHAAVGKPVTLAAPPHASYPGLGAKSLADGKISSGDYRSGLWLGFHGGDMTAVIDLGKPTKVTQMVARCLQSSRVGIYLPKSVRFEGSDDGKTFRHVATITPADIRPEGHKVQSLTADKLDATVRYVRVVAVNIATIPGGFPAAGKAAWLFVDEVMVNPAERP